MTDQQSDGACFLPPALDAFALLAAADGETTPDVEEHLRECRHCRARVEDLEYLQRLLRTYLHRVCCPDSETLVHYHAGLLEQPQYAEVKRHVAACPHCTRELRLLDRMRSTPLRPLHHIADPPTVPGA